MRTFLYTLALSFLMFGCGLSKKSDDESSTNSETDESSENKFTVEGVLQLDEIGESTATDFDLSEGQNLAGAKVFIAGFEDSSATTDDDGSFSLEIDTSSTELTSSEFTVLMWYTVAATTDSSTAEARFGTSQDIEADTGTGEAYDLGEVKLTYTMALHLSIQNESDEELSGCEVSVDGIGEQLLSIDKGSGDYDLDYLPPGTYDILYQCDSYVDQTVSVDVDAATKIDAWQTVPQATMVAE